MRAIVWVALSVLMLAAHPVRAAESDEVRSEAKERFSRGLHLFENGDNGGALAEFKRAHALIPNRLALYNIAMVYAAMGKPVEAVQSLDQVLADAGPLKTEYVDRARAAKSEQERRIGQIAVKVNTPAAIEVDGVKVADAPLPAPLRVAAGEHVVGAAAPGYLPSRQTVIVAGQAQIDASFELAPTEARLAHVDIRCPVPAAAIFVDGVSVGRTPLSASISVVPGTRVVEIRRPGYETARCEITLSDGASGEVVLDLSESAASGRERGKLRLTNLIEDGPLVVSVDGRSRGVYSRAIELPAGPHFVKLEQAGFESLERPIEIPVRGEVAIKVALRPTVETRAAQASRARTYRRWSAGALISGALAAATGATLAIWGNGKLSSAQSTLAQVQHDRADWGNGPCDATYDLSNAQRAWCAQSLADANSDVNKYRDVRLTGIVVAASGAALLGAGVVLWLVAPSPGQASDDLSYVPSIAAQPNGATLVWSGRF